MSNAEQKEYYKKNKDTVKNLFALHERDRLRASYGMTGHPMPEDCICRMGKRDSKCPYHTYLDTRI
jgi:hypothetical protein